MWNSHFISIYFFNFSASSNQNSNSTTSFSPCFLLPIPTQSASFNRFFIVSIPTTHYLTVYHTFIKMIFLSVQNLDISFESGYNNRKEIYKHYFVNGGAICLTYISTLQKTIKKMSLFFFLIYRLMA